MSVIYKIYCLDENIKDCYIGSTNDLTKRKYAHKKSCNSINCVGHNSKVYKFIRANGGWENFDFMILEQFENKMTKKDLEKIEGQYIINLNSKLNERIPTGLNLKEYHNEYYNKKKDYIKNRVNEYRKQNLENIKKTKQKYYESNKIEIAEKSKKYREQNKVEINEKNKQKVKCEFCNSLVSKGNMLRHHKSKKCLDTQS